MVEVVTSLIHGTIELPVVERAKTLITNASRDYALLGTDGFISIESSTIVLVSVDSLQEL
jgi:hypothetical protein